MIRIHARCSSRLDAEGVRQHLRARLGAVPRRIGGFAELALAGLCELPAGEGDCGLILGSIGGPRAEIGTVLEDLHQGLPLMPFGFIQAQAGVSLAAVCAQRPGIARATMVYAENDFWSQAARIAQGWFANGLDEVVCGFVETADAQMQAGGGMSDWVCWRRADAGEGQIEARDFPPLVAASTEAWEARLAALFETDRQLAHDPDVGRS